MNDRLPIDDALPAIVQALLMSSRLVVAAPPGAGKTTRLPLFLLGAGGPDGCAAPWIVGQRLLLLEPRRIAARMAAARMASQLGERVGMTVGLSTRIERLVSSRTRIEVMTDGLFTRRLLNDPTLGGIGAVLFDEFHERSLTLDLGLALALEAQEALRPDLRLIVMSATLDTHRIATSIDARVIESAGRAHPVDIVYLGASAEPLEHRVVRAVRRALAETAGSVLVFLPGQSEIQRTKAALEAADPPASIVPLYGALTPAEQDRAVGPPAEGERKVVLATDIAESALTIEGIAAVIDSGLARIAEVDPFGGTELVTRRASRASIDQRSGRAGRLGPGVCYRLWDAAGTLGLPESRTPEIATGDLAGLVLSLAEWGERAPQRLRWIDAPAPGRLQAAIQALRDLGALDEDGAITPRGRSIARLPMDPRLGAMIVGAQTPAYRALAAELAVLLGERGLGGGSSDLSERIVRFRRDRSPRGRALRSQAMRWADGAVAADASEAGRVLAAAMPSRIARQIAGARGEFQLASGRLARLDPSDALAGAPWLAVGDLTGTAASARILSAAPLSEADALEFGGAAPHDIAEVDAASGEVRARRERRLGAIVLTSTPMPAPRGPDAVAAIVTWVRGQGLSALPEIGAVRAVQARLRLAASLATRDWPDLSDAQLLDRLDEWLPGIIGDPPRLDKATAESVRHALGALMDWSLGRDLDELAPTQLTAPSGRALTIDYTAEGGPRVEGRVQEFFGPGAHPTILRGRHALVVSLLSPAQRQIAITRDLPAFWRGGYRDMVKDMRGRYPKHDWPDDPVAARPHEGKTKARL